MHKAAPRSSTKATIQAYSEWRPTLWRVRTSTGVNCGLFTSAEKASVFAYGVSLDGTKGAPEVKAEENSASFVWQGDDIGCSRAPAAIRVLDEFGQTRSLSVADALNMARLIDARGLARVVMALRACASRLHPNDLAAWDAHQDEYPIRTNGEAL